MANLVRPRDDTMVAEVARPVACDADRRDAERTGRAQAQPVVGVRVCIGRQRIRHAVEVAVAEERVRVNVICESVAIEVVWIDAAARRLDLVRTCREVAVGKEQLIHVCDTFSPANSPQDRRQAR